MFTYHKVIVLFSLWISLWLPKKNKKDIHCRDNQKKQYEESDCFSQPFKCRKSGEFENWKGSREDVIPQHSLSGRRKFTCPSEWHETFSWEVVSAWFSLKISLVPRSLMIVSQMEHLLNNQKYFPWSRNYGKTGLLQMDCWSFCPYRWSYSQAYGED